MASRMFWRGEIDRLNRIAIVRLELAVRREFARFRAEFFALQDRAAYDVVVQRHGARLAVVLGVHGRLTANTFALLAARMIGPPHRNSGVKATPAKTSDRIAGVLTALARLVVTGALVELVASALARDPLLVATVEAAIIAAAPDASPDAIAVGLLESRNIVAQLAQAAAISTQAAELGLGVENPPSPPPNANAGGSGAPPPPQTPPAGGSGAPPPKRSRFSVLVERIVRSEAPLRARRIAATSGRVIAEVLARAAAEGWGEAKIGKALELALGEEAAGHRARRIARTEMGGGQNGATFAIAQDRAAAGEALDKIWITTMDGRERASHHDLNRERQPLDQRFSNGLMHPHEFTAPLAEIVNCRCGLMISRRQSAPPGAP